MARALRRRSGSTNFGTRNSRPGRIWIWPVVIACLVAAVAVPILLRVRATSAALAAIGIEPYSQASVRDTSVKHDSTVVVLWTRDTEAKVVDHYGSMYQSKPEFRVGDGPAGNGTTIR